MLKWYSEYVSEPISTPTPQVVLVKSASNDTQKNNEGNKGEITKDDDLFVKFTRTYVSSWIVVGVVSKKVDVSSWYG